MLGTAPTSSGVRVSHEVALTYSAVFACTRVISETLASLPLNLVEQMDQRTTQKALSHPLYPILHDMPNPEMDIVTFLDMQQALTMNWGNSYAEVQRDFAGNVLGLWPIHPSRIPLCNIYRNANSPDYYRDIIAGQPGEIVYLVNNDDGTRTPIPASDMLHVPGVLSRNGITGISLPMTCPDAVGVAIATDRHAGAYFRNGAVSNMAIKSPKLVKKETAEYLREQWQRTFGGVDNHYKTLLLEDGMEPVNFSIAPEASQLLETRGFNQRVIAAQIYRVPSHMIGDKEASTYNNIEQEEMSFKTKTMLIWIVKWEKAIYRQLLSSEERQKYRAKFNVMGLLRGDSAARAQFYQVLFNIGVFSPNDIRELEDLNPVEGGEQRFVPANNLVPLDKIGEMAQATIDKLKAPPPAPQENIQPDPKTVENLLALRAEQGQFLEKVLLRDAANEAKEAARVELARQHREADEAQWGKRLEEIQAAQVLADRKLDAISERPAPEIPAPVMDSAPIVEAVESVGEKLIEAAKADKTAENDAKTAAAAEKLAVREAELASKQAEFDKQADQSQATSRRVVALALKVHIDRLVEHESKWLDRAVDKPLEWVAARGQYYERFVRYFIANLSECEADSEACGVVLDLKWAAEKYSGDSIRDLKMLDADASDNHHDKLKQTVKALRDVTWTDRAQQLANDLVERGVRLHSERKGPNA